MSACGLPSEHLSAAGREKPVLFPWQNITRDQSTGVHFREHGMRMQSPSCPTEPPLIITTNNVIYLFIRKLYLESRRVDPGPPARVIVKVVPSFLSVNKRNDDGST